MMYCPKCGTKHEDGAAFCTNCGMNLKQDLAPSVNESETKTENTSKSLKKKKAPNYILDGIIAIVIGALIFIFLWKTGFQYEKLATQSFSDHRADYTKYSYNWYVKTWRDFKDDTLSYIAVLLTIFFWTLGVGSLIKGFCNKTNRLTTVAIGVFLSVWGIIQFFVTRSVILRNLGYYTPFTGYLRRNFEKPIVWFFYSSFSLFLISFFLIIGTLKESPGKKTSN